MKAIILAGGLGTRLREETEFRPKPMVEVGGRPILWHIMKGLAQHGLTEFVIAAGYKADVIKDYFLNYDALMNDFTVTLGDRSRLEIHGGHEERDWRVTVAFTGDATLTGGRVLQAARFTDGQPFMVTYGDGLADVDVTDLLAFHRRHGRLATFTTVQPVSRFGVADIDDDGRVRRFREKPQLDGWINVGFFVFEPDVLRFIGDDVMLEDAPLAALAEAGQLMAYRHSGFWQPMDTYREAKLLNDLWATGHAPWKTW